MAFPPVIPLNEFGKISIKEGASKLRFIAFNSGSKTETNVVYTVPPGFEATITEIYNVIYQFISSPTGFVFKDEKGNTFARITLATAGSTVYGSVNYIQGFPITLRQNETISLEYTSGDLAGVAIMSVLVEEKIKN